MKIDINLLPPEIRIQQLKRTRFYQIQTIGVTVILVMFFLSSLTVALRILQNQNIKNYQIKLASAQQKVSDLKSTQVSLFVLKNRLTVINQYAGVSSKQSAMYTLIDKLIPPAVIVNLVGVDQRGETILSLSAPDYESLDALINNLTLKESNEGKIKKVSIESLNRGKDNFYRISLKVQP
ncbi:hypothetical protein KKE03_03420 [Patescibacteria group bacterium]|nr:hypothetical protein [Patescibacteria group bacterium]